MRKLRETRVLRGLSQDDIFMATRIDRGKYSRLERGELDPTPEDRQTLCLFFRMPEDELFPEFRNGTPERNRELYRRLKRRISLIEKIELLGNNPDDETYCRKLIALARQHGLEVD